MSMEQLSLFDHQKISQPLASRIRPEDLDGFVGQEHLVGKGKILRKLIEQDQIPSMIFWGPPGVGKTTLAGIIAGKTHAQFINFSAVTSGIKEIREVMAQAENSRRSGIRTVLFVDEIHRFNKAQQDAFLPYVEKGSIILIGATTENPSFGAGDRAFAENLKQPEGLRLSEHRHCGRPGGHDRPVCQRRCQDSSQCPGDGGFQRGNQR